MRRIGLCLVALLLPVLGWVIYVNDFRFVTEPVVVTAGGNRLTGTLVLPEHAPVKPGVVVFVHGDGPANASRDEGYYGIWETMAQQGYAVLSFDKPGVGGSGGNWLHQTMADRARETVDIIDWPRRDGRFDARCVGLWGTSQAGWVGDAGGGAFAPRHRVYARGGAGDQLAAAGALQHPGGDGGGRGR